MSRRAMTTIKGEFFDGTPISGEVPFEAHTDGRLMLAESEGPGIRVGVMANGASVSFSECVPDCDGVNESHSEYLGTGVGRITGTFHIHCDSDPSA